MKYFGYNGWKYPEGQEVHTSLYRTLWEKPLENKLPSNDQEEFLIFIAAPCILKSTYFTYQQMHYLLTWLKVLNLH